MRIEPEIAGVSLVLQGSFDPAVFTPDWFAKHGLISEGMANAANTDLVSPQIASFNADWLILLASQEVFIIGTMQSPEVRLLDLAVLTFREHLPNILLTSMSIYREVHFPMQNTAERNKIGKLLAPIEPWGDWGKKIDSDERHSGMTSLTMRQGNPEGRSSEGWIDVTVEPSNRKQVHAGVCVKVDDHYASEDSKHQSGDEIVRLLEKHFDESRRRSDQIIDHIMSLAER